jgi:hypothetical protein
MLNRNFSRHGSGPRAATNRGRDSGGTSAELVKGVDSEGSQCAGPFIQTLSKSPSSSTFHWRTIASARERQSAQAYLTVRRALFPSATP